MKVFFYAFFKKDSYGIKIIALNNYYIPIISLIGVIAIIRTN